MVIFGIDAHKRTHTVVAIDERGRQLAEQTTKTTTSDDHLALVRWADAISVNRLWAAEDCRDLSRRLEADLLGAGERIVRVPTRLMAEVRSSARTIGKSDSIDALAVARAALREPDLPMAILDGPTRELQLLVSYRDAVIRERTRWINRVRWYLHELDPAWDPTRAEIKGPAVLDEIARRFGVVPGTVPRFAVVSAARIRSLTADAISIEDEICDLVRPMAPALLSVPGIRELTAATLLGEVADIRRFRSRDAFARFTGTAPKPHGSAGKTRQKYVKTGNRRANAVLHLAARSQSRFEAKARAYLEQQSSRGKSPKSAIRALKRYISNAVYTAMRSDAAASETANPMPENERSAFLGAAEVAAMFAGSIPTRPGFPAPVATLKLGRVWDRGAVVAWRTVHGVRRRGCPPAMTAATVALVQDLRNSRIGWGSIAKHLNEIGVSSPRGKTWYGSGVRRVYLLAEARPMRDITSTGLSSEHGESAQAEQPPQLLGATEIAKRLGVTRSCIQYYTKTAPLCFPRPQAELARGRVWLWSDVEHWANLRGMRVREQAASGTSAPDGTGSVENSQPRMSEGREPLTSHAAR